MAAIAVAALVAGCGGGNDSDRNHAAAARRAAIAAQTTRSGNSGTTQPPLDEAEFIKRGNAVCDRNTAAMRKSFAEYQREQGPNISQAKLFAGATLAFFLTDMQFLFDHLNWRGPPIGNETPAIEMFHTLQLSAVSAERQRHFTSARQLAAHFRRFSLLAHRAGLDSCVVTASIFVG